MGQIAPPLQKSTNHISFGAVTRITLPDQDMTMSSVTRAAAALLLAAPLFAQQPGGPAEPATKSAKAVKAPMPAAEWNKIEVLGASALSPDGKWVAYDLRRDAGGGELHWKALSSDADHVVRNASGEIFASNSRWLVYTIAPDTAGGRGGRVAGAATGAGRGAGAAGGAAGSKSKVGIVDLASGATSTLEEVTLYSFSKDGSHIALRRASTPGRRGADLVIRNLAQGSDVTLGNVAEFAWSDEGATLAMTIDVDGKTGNGVQLLNATTGAIMSLDASDQHYINLQWRPRSDDLVAMRSRIDTTFADTAFDVIAWRSAASARSTKTTYDFTKDAAFPAGMRVASYRRPQWSDDGATLFFGIAPRDARPVPAERGAPVAARVEVWHWKDLREYHQQNRQSAQDRQKTHLVAWRLNQPAIVRLADDSMETVQLADNQKTAITSDEAPYFNDVLSGRQYRDVYTVDIATGKRAKVITKTPFAPTLSPDGRYVLYSQAGEWHTYDMSSGARSNLTGKVKSAFVDMEDDHPVADRRPYGVAGWTTGAQSVLLYDRFDVWQVKPDGSDPIRLTRGKEDATVYRVVAESRRGGGGRGAGGFGGPVTPLDPEDRWIDPSRPITLSATGEYTRKSGYARLTIGQPAQRTLWADKSITRLEKARDADVYSYVTQTYEESPNLFVGSSAFTDAKQVSHTNAMLGQYAWGKQVLMDYTTKRGETLQMMLTYPADYEPGKKYPMVVYYYEKLSQGFHDFVVPGEKSAYNTSVFSQNGYFVLRPDILFHAREPGYSGLDCVTAAVKTALATGMIDEKKVGNMGHSWGGYQSAFYAVHGKGMFAATIAGAPLTDLISMYGYTSYNTGSAETGHFETGQERMQVPLWDDPQSYIRNSTVFAVDSLQTPLLLEEGDADGNVNYWQGMELYNFGRRLGKQVIFLVYNGENHNVARPESQLDYHTRQLEWFNHYLKGEAAPDWMTKGESFLTRQKMLAPSGPPASTTPQAPVTAGTITGAYAP